MRRALVGLCVLLTAACGGAAPPRPTPAATVAPPVQDLVVQVVRTFPHDREAFTQGLVYSGGRLFESTGIEGRSSVREVDLESGRVLRKTDLPSSFFGEGLARVGDRLVQITWRNGRALVYTVDGFEKTGEHNYDGEGWGLCHDGVRLVMSDGSDRLVFRDPESFGPLGAVRVTRQGAPVRKLNELECVGGDVYANVWETDVIVRANVRTGAVSAWIDASSLLSAEERARADVLNGIAYVPERQTFLVTGKLWPRMFEVRFVARGASPSPR